MRFDFGSLHAYSKYVYKDYTIFSQIMPFIPNKTLEQVVLRETTELEIFLVKTH